VEQLHERTSGLDVHRDTVSACVRTIGPKGGVVRVKEQFKTTTVGLARLSAWLVERDVDLVAMEATGVYVRSEGA
jgi:transposase